MEKNREAYVSVGYMKSLIARIYGLIDGLNGKPSNEIRRKMLEWLEESLIHLNNQESGQLIDPAWELANTMWAMCEDVGPRVKN